MSSNLRSRARGRASTQANEIRVRRFKPHLPDEVDPMLVMGEPEISSLAVALSYLFADLEPYLIRTVRAATPLVSKRALGRASEDTTPSLLEDMGRFSAQEGKHYREHIRFNKALRLPCLPALEDLRAQLAQDYQRYSDAKPMHFNLAYAEGFEAFTTAMALFLHEIGWIEQVHPAVRELFEWHLVEELEHRTVAFDVYEALGRGYLYRLAVGLFAHVHVGIFVGRAAGLVNAVQADSRTDSVEARPRARERRIAAMWIRNTPFLLTAIRQFWPKLLRTYTPWYTPRTLRVPTQVRKRWEYYSTRES